MAKMQYGYLVEVLTTVDNPTALLKTRKESLFGLIPEFRECEKTILYRNTNPTDVFTHSLRVTSLTPKESLELRLAALFHDIGKPKCYSGDNKYRYHGEQSSDIFVRFAEKNQLDPELTKRVSLLITYHDLPVDVDSIKYYLNTILSNFDEEGIKQLFQLKKADVEAKIKQRWLEDKVIELEAVKNVCLQIRRDK